MYLFIFTVCELFVHMYKLSYVLVARPAPGWSTRKWRKNCLSYRFLIRRASERTSEGERSCVATLSSSLVMIVMRLRNFNQDIGVRPPCTPHPGEINNQVWYPAGGTKLRAATLSISPAQSWQRRPYWDWADGSFWWPGLAGCIIYIYYFTIKDKARVSLCALEKHSFLRCLLDLSEKLVWCSCSWFGCL